MKYRLFSVDDHIIEPSNVYVDRLPAKYRDVGPRIVEENGQQSWVMEDQVTPYVGLNAVAGFPPNRKNVNPTNYNQVHPACYDAKIRAEEFRKNGIVASLGFPDVAGFGGYRFAALKDRDLANLCVQAYNDWQFEEWCSAAPDMFVPTIMCQIWDPDLAAEEVKRCADKGARSLTFPDDPFQAVGVSFNDPQWDPVWSACEETETVVSLHGGGSGPLQNLIYDPGVHFLALIAGGGTEVGGRLICNLLTSPVTRKFPGLKFIITESGAGFVPYLLERAETVFNKNKGWHGLDDTPFREIFERSIWLCAVPGERYAIEQRDEIGIGKILWESDFPHSETDWPNSQESVENLYGDFPADVIDKLTHGNAQKLLRFEGEVH